MTKKKISIVDQVNTYKRCIKYINYKKIFAIKAKNEEIIKKICPKATHQSGIYIFHRIDENGFKFAYVGLATTSLLTRLAQHLEGYSQWIDLSIRKHKLFDELNNPTGYKIDILCYCKPEECDEKEQFYIKQVADAGYQLKNITGGSQGKGKFNINDNKPARGYMDGLKQGEKNLKKKLRDIIDKYLVISLKKDGKLAQNALNKFNELIYKED